MMVVVYADLYLIMNWAADFILLKLITRNQRIHNGRVALAAGVGSIGAMILVLLPKIWNLPGSIILAGLMISVTYAGRKHSLWLRQLVKLYGYGFLCSGFVQTLYQWMMFSSVDNVRGTICALLLWILLIGVCYMIISWVVRKYGSMETRQQFIELEVVYRGNRVLIAALVDTGNQLKEKVTGYPVLIVESRDEWQLTALADHHEKLYWIPYQTASCESACMVGFKPDELRWPGGSTKEVIVAVSRLKQLDPKKQYNAIVSPQVLI